MKKLLLGPLPWSHIESYLDRALDLRPDECATWLAELTATQPAIASALRELLADLERANAEGFLCTPLDSLGPVPADRAAMTGKSLGAYLIDRLLGRGGMGEVWLASRNDGRFEGRCAIKLLDGAVARPKLTERFRREGRLLARLAHPNIARLIDAGTAENGRQYLALEYVDGERIDYYCELHKLDVESRVRLFLGVVSAVAHAHANLIVHRDLKPSNVLVASDGVVKLLGFGIAKLLGPNQSDGEEAVTRFEELALTPDYAAPEQLLGELPSTATDVYQLGMLLYVLLARGHPVQRRGNRAEQGKAALHEQIPRASDFADRSLRPALRGDLDAILAKALRKDPGERYATAAALHQDLLRFLKREPVNARRGAALYRARKFAARHRFAVSAVSLAVIGLCGALGFSLQQARESSQQRDRALLEARRTQAQIHFMTSMMFAIGEPGQPISPQEMLDNGVKLLEAQYADNPEFVVRELIRVSGRYTNWDNRQREYAVLTKAESIARRSANSRELARVQCNAVETEVALGRVDRAAARLAEGRSALVRAQGADLGDEVDCLSAAAALSDAQGRVPDSIRDLERAVSLLETRGMTVNVRYAPLLDRLGELYRSLGDFKKSYQYHRRARLSKERSGYGGTAGWNATLHNESIALYELGEVQAALEQQAAVLQRGRAHAPAGRMPVAESLAYGGMLQRVERSAEALQWLERALADSAATADRVANMNARVARARVLLSLHQTEEAAAQLQFVDDATVGANALALRHPRARALLVQSEMLALQGRRAEAFDIAASLLAQCRNGELGLGSYLNAALLAASRAALPDRPAQAQSLAQEALQVAERRARDPERSADVGEALLALARAKIARRDSAGAQTAARRAGQILARALGAGHSLTTAAAALAAEAGDHRGPGPGSESASNGRFSGRAALMSDFDRRFRLDRYLERS